MIKIGSLIVHLQTEIPRDKYSQIVNTLLHFQASSQYLPVAPEDKIIDDFPFSTASGLWWLLCHKNFSPSPSDTALSKWGTLVSPSVGEQTEAHKYMRFVWGRSQSQWGIDPGWKNETFLIPKTGHLYQCDSVSSAHRQHQTKKPIVVFTTLTKMMAISIWKLIAGVKILEENKLRLSRPSFSPWPLHSLCRAHPAYHHATRG